MTLNDFLGLAASLFGIAAFLLWFDWYTKDED